jgi:ketosteroid isomerase-like protein
MLHTRNVLRTCGMALALALASAPVLAKDDPKAADEVIALARAQWAAEIAGKSPAEQLASVAEDYTEFNQDYPTLLVGKAMALKMLSVPSPGTPLFSDLQNARVQVYGDTAILTYNFTGINKGADGKVGPNTAKSTRVYVRQGGQWLLVHANFAPVNAAD